MRKQTLDTAVTYFMLSKRLDP